MWKRKCFSKLQDITSTQTTMTSVICKLQQLRKFILKIEPLLKKERENGFKVLIPNIRELIGLADAIDF